MTPSAWIEVDLPAIRQNVKAVSDYVGESVDVMSVVKANGYGHGMLEASRAALEGGAACLGVATPSEGVDLRKLGIDAPVVVLGALLPHHADVVVEHGLSQVVSSTEAVDAMGDAANRHARTASLHLKVETGMGRVGCASEEVPDILAAILAHPRLELEGLMTHIGWGEDQLDQLRSQAADFHRHVDGHLEPATSPRWVHAANSLVTLVEPDARFNLVRPGLLTYGIPPANPSLLHSPLLDNLTPALSIRARITQIRTLKKGHAVSYGGRTVVDRETRAGIVPVGYGDGYPRSAEPTGIVLVDGTACPILGVVCMDQFVVDVTDTDASVGDVVTLLGSSAYSSITANDLARDFSRIPYEVVAGLTARLPRLYQV